MKSPLPVMTSLLLATTAAHARDEHLSLPLKDALELQEKPL